MPQQTGSYDLSAAKKASQSADNYITEISTEISNDGVFVHTSGDSSTSTGSGVHIGASAINIIKSGVSYIKAWIENTIPYIRIGREDKGNVLIDNDSVDIRDASTKVASFTDSSITFYNANIPDKPIFDITAEATTDAISSACLQRHSSGASEIDSKLMYVDQRISMDEYFDTTEIGESMNCSSGLYATSFISGVRTAEAGVVCSTELARDPVDGLTRDDSLIILSADSIHFTNARTEERVLEITSGGYIVRACDGVISGISASSFKTPTTGTITSVTMYRHNGIIYMNLGFKNTSSRNSGYAVLDTYLDYENQLSLRRLKPVVSSYGIGYFGSAPLTAFFGSSDGHLVVRNTSPSAVTVWNSTSKSGATVTISWPAPLEGFSS